jgi:predicted enzyme related to lactoylglutathione lyase
MLNFGSIMIGTSDSKKLGEFYEKVLQKAPEMEDGGWYGFSVGNTFLSIGNHSEVKGNSKEPQRIILNLETTEVKEEFERIKDLGAEVIKEPYEMQGAWIATLADPDGNFFQLMSPWESESKSNS